MTAINESIEYNIFNIPTILLMSWFVWFIIIVMFFLTIKKFRIIPSGIQNLTEYILDTIYNLSDSIIGDHNESKKYYPLFVNIFLFIFFSNLLGLIPGLISPTSSLNTTLAIAIVVFIFYHYQGIKKYGFNYIKHFFTQINLKTVPIIMKLPMAIFGYIIIPIIELISHMARPLSLSVRLFGNILAKEVLLGILSMLVIVFIGLQNPFIKIILTISPIILRPLIILLGVLVSLIQAGVFLILSMIYISGAVMMEE